MSLSANAVKGGRSVFTVKCLMHIFTSQNLKNKPPGKIIHPKFDLISHATPHPLLGTGNPAAHQLNRLMLLGSPPDMVHSRQLRWDPSFNTEKCDTDRTRPNLQTGSHPCYSGFQEEEAATLPAGMILPCGLFHFYRIIISQTFFNCNCFFNFSQQKV